MSANQIYTAHYKPNGDIHKNASDSPHELDSLLNMIHPKHVYHIGGKRVRFDAA